MLLSAFGFSLIFVHQAWANSDSPIKVNVDTSCECGALAMVDTRIVGGSLAPPHLYPWMVAILLYGNLHCGGSVINNQYILTAGHCLKWYMIEDLTVVLGTDDRVHMEEGSATIALVEQLIVHEAFASDYIHDTNDIGLIKLKKPLTYSPTVKPICLPGSDDDLRNKTGMVTGWGRTAQNGSPSRYLRRASVKIVDPARCKNSTIGDHIQDTMLCAYEFNTDACQGDSGGPLVYEAKPGKMEQIGIVSWGIGCARPGIPGIYTRVSEYLHWIKTNTAEAVYCQKRF